MLAGAFRPVIAPREITPVGFARPSAVLYVKPMRGHLARPGSVGSVSLSRPYVKRPGCNHHFIFGNAMASPPTFVFWDADSESDIKNFEFEKIDPTGHLKVLKFQ